MCDLSENIVAGHVDILHVDTRKGKKAWKRPLKREDAFHVTKGYVVYKIHFIRDTYSLV